MATVDRTIAPPTGDETPRQISPFAFPFTLYERRVSRGRGGPCASLTKRAGDCQASLPGSRPECSARPTTTGSVEQRHFRKRRPSGVDHEAQQAEPIGLDEALTSRGRGDRGTPRKLLPHPCHRFGPGFDARCHASEVDRTSRSSRQWHDRALHVRRPHAHRSRPRKPWRTRRTWHRASVNRAASKRRRLHRLRCRSGSAVRRSCDRTRRSIHGTPWHTRRKPRCRQPWRRHRRPEHPKEKRLNRSSRRRKPGGDTAAVGREALGVGHEADVVGHPGEVGLRERDHAARPEKIVGREAGREPRRAAGGENV